MRDLRAERVWDLNDLIADLSQFFLGRFELIRKSRTSGAVRDRLRS